MKHPTVRYRSLLGESSEREFRAYLKDQPRINVRDHRKDHVSRLSGPDRRIQVADLANQDVSPNVQVWAGVAA